MGDRYIDPNSGAAPQPGGYAGHGLVPDERLESQRAVESPSEPDDAAEWKREFENGGEGNAGDQSKDPQLQELSGPDAATVQQVHGQGGGTPEQVVGEKVETSQSGSDDDATDDDDDATADDSADADADAERTDEKSEQKPAAKKAAKKAPAKKAGRR